MGSIARMNAQKRFVKTFGTFLEKKFSHLIGTKIEKISDIHADYYVQGLVTFSDGSNFPVHHRWSSEEEDSEGIELDEDFLKLEDYFNQYIIETSVIKVKVHLPERDDEAYLTVYNENNYSFEIALGFDPEHNEIYSYAKEFIPPIEWEKYLHQKNRIK